MGFNGFYGPNDEKDREFLGTRNLDYGIVSNVGILKINAEKSGLNNMGFDTRTQSWIIIYN